MPLDARKDALRRSVLEHRQGVSAETWKIEDTARAAALLAFAAPQPAGTVALYASRPGEPGTTAVIDGFVALGWQVLLPALAKRVHWARFEGWAHVRPGWAGIPEPTGPRLAEQALAQAGLILAPCLALGRDLTRLGTGGGWYDRALAHRCPTSAVVAVAREAELFDTVPVESHDRTVDGYVTERRSVLPRW